MNKNITPMLKQYIFIITVVADKINEYIAYIYVMSYTYVYLFTFSMDSSCSVVTHSHLPPLEQPRPLTCGVPNEWRHEKLGNYMSRDQRGKIEMFFSSTGACIWLWWFAIGNFAAVQAPVETKNISIFPRWSRDVVS